MAKNYQLEQVRLYVATLLNEEQSEYSKLLAQLKVAIGKTKEFDDAARVLTQVYDAKIEILNKIYNEIQGI